ncbi:glycosyltransferase family 2 protein [Formicincola oecophyllae]|uniref:Glycosyltransferase family 2 protein n=1 Tax=Formicincola oecophyllae TaxID=2558361 RepID=A0A4Y6U7T4_9PROT|nr:glycosyltransferase family 2 protein [Formicincola oecophyllae]QDH13493.1 glycosyltransferase family 2 protein [Formicincola oecophyllae]
MTKRTPPQSPLLTIVMPCHDESANVGPVCAELAKRYTAANPLAFNIVAVDDGSTDDTLARLHDAAAHFTQATGALMTVLRHEKCLGKSAALHTAIKTARTPWIITLDGDGQDDPSAIPALWAKATAMMAQGQLPLVVAVRTKRRDGLWRLLASRLANKLRQSLLQDDCPDTAAPLKLFPRQLFLMFPQFEGQHRFLPALAKSHGAHVGCIEGRHRPRLHGFSKYTNLGRAKVGVADLAGVWWLQRRLRVPGAFAPSLLRQLLQLHKNQQPPGTKRPPPLGKQS